MKSGTEKKADGTGDKSKKNKDEVPVKEESGKVQNPSKEESGKVQSPVKETSGKENSGKVQSPVKETSGKENSGKIQPPVKETSGKVQSPVKETSGKEKSGKVQPPVKENSGKENSGKVQLPVKENSGKENSGKVQPPDRGIRADEMQIDPRGSRFPHYTGYVLAVAGADYTVLGCGVGGSGSQALPPRDITHKINDSAILASHGFHNDVIIFNKDVQAKIDKCEETLQKQMSLLGSAGIIKALLYNRRCYTYFKCNILAGLDQDEGGCLFVFDQLGGFKREAIAAGGSSSLNMLRLLKRKVGLKHSQSIQASQSETEAADIITEVFRDAEEQRLFNGHAVVLYTITKTGTAEEFRKVKD